MIDDTVLGIARANLTPGQFAVFVRWHRPTSQRAIALELDLARTTVVDRYDNACRTLRRHGVRFTPDGRPYLEEQTPA